MKCTRNEIYDPFTKRCLKLQMKGTLYDRYIVPFLLGDDSFLNALSARDQQKFVTFLKQERVFVHHPQVRVRNTRERIQREERRKREKKEEQHIKQQQDTQKWQERVVGIRNKAGLELSRLLVKQKQEDIKKQQQQRSSHAWIKSANDLRNKTDRDVALERSRLLKMLSAKQKQQQQQQLVQLQPIEQQYSKQQVNNMFKY